MKFDKKTFFSYHLSKCQKLSQNIAILISPSFLIGQKQMNVFKFDYLTPEGIKKKWNAFFPKVQITATAEKLTLLTPGDFNTIYSTLRFYDDSEISPEIIENALKSEIAYKDNRAGRVMGF